MNSKEITQQAENLYPHAELFKKHLIYRNSIENTIASVKQSKIYAFIDF
jgi:hypothetical protein